MKHFIFVLCLLLGEILAAQKTLKIEKGNHYSKVLNSFFCSYSEGEYVVKITFSELPKKEWDFFNKLIGVSSILGTRYSSERIGWRHVDSTCFQLCLYSERNKNFSFLERTYIFAEKIEGGYLLTIPIILKNGLIGYYDVRRSFQKYKLPFIADPYFGGKEVSDQDYYFIFTKK